MEYQASTIEMDSTGFEDLKSQIVNGRTNEANKEGDIRDKPQEKENRKEAPPSKKQTFRRGEESMEIDDDYEVEFMADKKPVRLTLRELKERAAGDVAVKNRMHALAEEKKRVQATFKEFATLAKNDPLGALEFISSKANEADSEFEYKQYIEKLAEQAESLGKMDDKDRKALELEKKLKKAEQDLSQKERQQAVVLRKQEMQTNYPEIGDSEFSQMVDAVLGSEELVADLEDEHDVMDRVEELIQETLTQRDIMTVIREINPQHLNDNQLIFSLSDQLRQNPDLDEEDVRDILRQLIGTERKASPPSQKERDARILSNKQRQSMGVQYREQGASDFDLLKQQLLEKQNEIRKTPIYKR